MVRYHFRPIQSQRQIQHVSQCTETGTPLPYCCGNTEWCSCWETIWQFQAVKQLPNYTLVRGLYPGTTELNSQPYALQNIRSPPWEPLCQVTFQGPENLHFFFFCTRGRTWDLEIVRQAGGSTTELNPKPQAPTSCPLRLVPYRFWPVASLTGRAAVPCVGATWWRHGITASVWMDPTEVSGPPCVIFKCSHCHIYFFGTRPLHLRGRQPNH